jgi:3-hydroxyacyl-CoA dehydrogenase/enoyl-CoA hydratase/3-hydroxybutyryl-CoA epimerase/enoyl-CoA isomerase|tara:strand:- start:83 stop:1105 length:1023 start_codon:yes stop_codon:yes gene_type:complete
MSDNSKFYSGLISKAEKISANADIPKTVAVLGAGAMGMGIASVLAEKASINVNLYDIDVGQFKLAEDIPLIRTTTDLSEAIESSDLVIEAVPEVLSLKREVVSKCVDQFVATNTSTFKVEDISSRSNFGGMHFFNPVSKMPLVEVVSGSSTSEETVAILCKTSLAIGKVPLICNDCSGFVVNRMLMPYLIEFDKMVSEGHDYSHIDTVMKNHGWPMGPAELCDLVGLDVIYHGSQSIAKAYDHITVSDNSVCHQLYKNKDFGRKSHRGFYSYDVISGKRAGRFSVPGKVRESSSAIKDRLMSPMLEEADRLLNEDIVDSAAEIDVALALGAGLPPFITSI